MSAEHTTAEVAAALREWVGENLQQLVREDTKLPQRRERATIHSVWKGPGAAWPQTVGEDERPAQVQMQANCYQIVIVVPGDTPQDFVASITPRLRERAQADATLGDRVRDAMIHDGTVGPETVPSPEFGEDAQQLTIEISVFDLTNTVGESGAES